MDIFLQNRIFVLLTFAVCSILSILNVEPSANTYLGCYDEYGGEEVFTRGTQSTLSNLDGCRESCRQRKDPYTPYTFAGLWGGRFCYCTDVLKMNLTKQVNSLLCDAPCPGEQTKACGASSGGLLFSVYSVCQQGLYGRKCTKQCNCKDNMICTMKGVCPEEKCASGWKLNRTISNEYKCSIDADECLAACNSTSDTDCHNCSSVQHGKCKNTKGSFECVCENGFIKTSNGHCEDINECTKGTTHNCSHFCNNTEGSYKCSCPSGYELEGRFTCKDINECGKTPSVCDQTCTNTKGSYNCGCTVGFRLNTTNNFKCDDIDECAEHRSKCSDNCTNTIGNYTCSCRSGYELRSNIYTCNDIDECQKNISLCEQKCENSDGSYTCKCNSGYKLNITNRFKCDDIDECAEHSGNCNQTCDNVLGSYRCSCKTGYELDSDQHMCNDIDECYMNTSNCSQECKNTAGSYECRCRDGFELLPDKHRCEDIDECHRQTSKCNQNCSNTYGSYNCSCYVGYQLESEFNCIDIDECYMNTSNCSQECKNTAGSYECRCRDGFELHHDKHRCEDIDECHRQTSKCNQNCSNTYGSYNCSCYVGYQLESEFNCIDIDECYMNTSNCSQECKNTAGSYECRCRDGFELHHDKHRCEDIDECLRRTSKCNQNCSNTYGWYNCSCYVGYQLEREFNCIDINECSINNGGCQHYCNNTEGSFVCSCRPGYEKIAETIGETYNCTDIDECVTKTHQCMQTCINEDGNYSCSCISGFSKVGEFECSKDLLGMILGVVIFILLIWIVIIVIILLKVKQIFPFDEPRSINNFWKRTQDSGHYENGTKELTETMAKSTFSPAISTETAVKKFKKTCIAVKDFKKYIEKINSSGGFEEEFRSIPMVSDLSYEFAQSQALKSKNRFKNILPYDENRVVLDEVNDDPLTTYINASFIKGYSPQDKIIASHGPTPNTVDDFWRMIWQYEVSVIVMVTKCFEDAKRKCEQYWPLEGSMESGDLTISLVSTEKWPDYIITRLKVTQGSKSRLLVHLLFTAWPDHGVPDHATSLLSFRRAVRNVIVANKFFLVHCSAGVGRTGTFLAIDFLLQQAKEKRSVDVYKYLQGLRDQRMNAVQTLDQYEFIHLALLEAMTLGETVVSCSALAEHRKHLNSLNPFTGKTFIQTEFDMLQEMHPPLSAEAASVALAKDNVSRNRDTQLVPADVNRVMLRETETGNDYINAVFVSSYRLKDAFISAELPTNETLNSFWTMVLNNKCKLIAFLDTSDVSNDLKNPLLVPVKTKLLAARHKVWTHSFEPKKLSDNCNSYSVAVSNPPNDDEEIYANAQEIPSFKVLVLHFGLLGPIAELLPQVNEQIKTSSDNIKDNGPVVIVSRDGVNPSGQYIAVSNLLEMATSQHEVDVFNAVHNIKKTQPYFITSLDEYQMIFDALEAEGDMSTYANV